MWNREKTVFAWSEARANASKNISDQNSFRRDEPDDLADEIEHINRAVEHCERRNQHEV